MTTHHLMGILVSKRRANATQIQEVLTEHGCAIRTRLGLHEAGDACSEEGLMILHLADLPEEVQAMLTQLNQIDGVKAQLMSL